MHVTPRRSRSGWLSRSPRVVVPALTEALQDDDRSVRFGAVNLLGPFAPHNRDARTVILGALEHGDPFVRMEAVRTLSWCHASPQLIPAIKDAIRPRLNDEHPMVRAAVVATLGRLGQWTLDDVQRVLGLLDDPDPDTRMRVVSYLPSGIAVPRVVRACCRALEDPDALVRRAAAQRLESFGVDAEEARGPLRSASEGPDQAVRQAALDAFRTIERKSREFHEKLPEIMADLASESPLVRRQSAEFLGQCAPKAVLAVPVLIRALDDSDATVRCARRGHLPASARPPALRSRHWPGVRATTTTASVGPPQRPPHPSSLTPAEPLDRAHPRRTGRTRKQGRASQRTETGTQRVVMGYRS